MKKFFSLCTFVALYFILSSSVVFAANWQWITSNEEYGYFFDTETIQFGVKLNSVTPVKKGIDTDRILFWEKIFFTQEGANSVVKLFNDDRFYSLDHCISQITYSIPERTETIHLLVFYDKNGNIIQDVRKDHTEKIILDSYGDFVFKSICSYAKEHRLEISANTSINSDI